MSIAITCSTLATLAVVVFLGVTWVRGLGLRGNISADSMLWLCLAGITGFMCTSKVLSPQYVVWLLPVVAAGLGIATKARAELNCWATGLLVVTVGTHLVYPWLYTALVLEGPGSVIAAGVLLGRNLVLAGLCIWAGRMAWSLVAADATDGESQEPVPLVRGVTGPVS